jgi:organic hydroperoxide reductase OsmC/OhrA
MSATASSRAAVRPKEFHFPLSVEWIGERRVAARVAGKPVIEITPPPVFRGTDPSAWSPEDFLVAAAASCLAVTFTGLAARAGLNYTMLKVDADGVAGRRDDGRFGFTRLLLRLQVETEQAEEAQRLAKQAEETCLVSASLDLPVETRIEVTPPAGDRKKHPNGRTTSKQPGPRRRHDGAAFGPGGSGGRESCLRDGSFSSEARSAAPDSSLAARRLRRPRRPLWWARRRG